MRFETLGMLVDIRDSARFIAEDTAGAPYEEFLSDRRMWQVVERNLTIIGEAINRLRRRDPDTAAKIEAIPQIVGMRNVITHGYDVIDYATVCRAIHESLPILRAQIEALLPEEDREAQEQAGRESCNVFRRCQLPRLWNLLQFQRLAIPARQFRTRDVGAL
jgi:uncharacterized protein with HEPN domain